MPKKSKKTNNKKNAHEPKDQRKPVSDDSRNQAGKSERKAEKVEETKSELKVYKKTTNEEPGPELSKNLKRETDEIVKIPEAENAKYKKKEIQSNWAKYEMPLENYEEEDDHYVGADYEKLIQIPLIVGGHFQFKHEKSWGTSTVPTPYNKYFEINMDSLSTAISTIPFYERNDINQSEFSETDLLGMNMRASKYKSKYFNDKSFSVETIAQEKILKSMTEKKEKTETLFEEITESDNNLDFNVPKTGTDSSVQCDFEKQVNSNSIYDFNFFFKNVPDKIIGVLEAVKCTDIPQLKHAIPKGPPVDSAVIRSKEELERWLDDFLDS